MPTTPVLIYEWLNKTFFRNHAAHHFCHKNVQQKNKGCVLPPSAKSKHFGSPPFPLAFNSVSSSNFRAASTAPFCTGSVIPIIVRGCPQTWRRIHLLWACFLPFGSAQVQWQRRSVPPCWRDTRALCTRSSLTSQWWSTSTRWTFLMGWTGRWITEPSFTLTACPTRWMPLIMTSKLEKLVWMAVF